MFKRVQNEEESCSEAECTRKYMSISNTTPTL